MSDETEAKDEGGTIYDAPNQEAVGLPPPWEEGTGGSSGEPEAEQAEEESGGEKSLDAMTKAELLAYAQEHGIEASDSMTKDEIRKAIDEGQ